MVFCTLNSHPLAHAGDFAGNGGDAVNCLPNPRVSPFYGYYVLDYVLARINQPEKLVYFGNYHKANREIILHLTTQLPLVGRNYHEFVNSYYRMRKGKQAAHDPIYWSPARSQLININDEKLIQELPKNCRHDFDPDGKVKLFQAVHMIKRELQTVFYYDDNIFKLLEKKGEVTERNHNNGEDEQLSWMLIHEWIWNLASLTNAKDVDAIVNRELNLYLHTFEFFRDRSRDIAQVFGVKGLSRFISKRTWEDSYKERFVRAESIIHTNGANATLQELDNLASFFTVAKRNHEYPLLRHYANKILIELEHLIELKSCVDVTCEQVWIRGRR